MKKLSMLFVALVVVLLAAPVAFAQEGGAAPAQDTRWIVITAGFAMALAAGACGLGQARIASAACEGMARNPGAADAIRLAMILGLVFIETLVIFTLVVVLLIVPRV